MEASPDIPPPPEQETEAPNRHIPPEIIEKILLNLPIKSLLRFSLVSTSWKSDITSPQFAAKRGGARKILVINDNPSCFNVREAFYRPLSTVTPPSSLPVCPFQADVKLKAFCDNMWCVVAKKSTYLLNPSTGAYKKLSHAPPLTIDWWRWGSFNTKVAYGLGYDDVDDDYKLLKIIRVSNYSREDKSLLYSLKTDSWREIPSHFHGDFFPDSNGLFVNGALHWLVISHAYNRQPRFMSALIAFDFSSEEFRVLQQPNYLPEVNLEIDVVDVAVLRLKLCVFLNCRRSFRDSRFVLWAMEESWTKLYEIRYKSIPPIVSEFRRGTWFILRPLYIFEDGRIVIWGCSGYKKWNMIVYKDRKVVEHWEVVAPSGTKAVPSAGSPSSRVRAGFVYTESLVSL